MTHTEPAQAWYFGDRFADHLAYFTQDASLDAEALGVLAWILCQPPGEPLPWAAIKDRFDLTERRLETIMEDLQVASERLQSHGAEPRP